MPIFKEYTNFDAVGIAELIKTKTNKEMVNVFVPTTPYPTSGFLLLFPVEDVIELDMSVEDAIKLVVSAGLVIPNE